MKFNSRFIALGLGISIFFTGSCLGYSYFSDTATKSNVLKIGKLVEEKPEQPTIETEAEIDDDKELELKLKNTGIKVEDIESVEFVSGSGVFNKTSHSAKLDKDKHDNEIQIKFNKHIKIKNISTQMPSKDRVTIKINYKDREDTYEISLIQKFKGDDDLYAFWQMIDSKPMVIEDNLEIKPDDTIKSETDTPSVEKPEDPIEPKPEVEVPVEPKPEPILEVKPEVVPQAPKVESSEQIEL